MNRKMKRALAAVGLGKKAPAADENTIRNEYHQRCAQAGELQYKIGEFTVALKQLNNEIKQLNAQYSEILEAKAAEERRKQAEAAKAPKAGEANAEVAE